MAQRHVGSLDCGSVRGVALVVGNTGEVAEVRKNPSCFGLMNGWSGAMESWELEAKTC